MCQTIPAKIVKIKQTTALVQDYNSHKKEVMISALPDVKVNDWILVNTNLAVQKISKDEAEELTKLLNKK